MNIARRRHLIQGTVCILAALWCASLLAPPLLQASGHLRSAILWRLAFDPICHQDPQRSFWLAGSPLAVCARCCGIYAGFLAGCLAVTAGSLGYRIRSVPFPAGALLLAAAPAAAQWALAQAGLLVDTGWLRAATGALFGAVAAACLLPAVNELLDELTRPSERMTHAKAR